MLPPDSPSRINDLSTHTTSNADDLFRPVNPWANGNISCDHNNEVDIPDDDDLLDVVSGWDENVPPDKEKVRAFSRREADSFLLYLEF